MFNDAEDSRGPVWGDRVDHSSAIGGAIVAGAFIAGIFAMFAGLFLILAPLALIVLLWVKGGPVGRFIAGAVGLVTIGISVFWGSQTFIERMQRDRLLERLEPRIAQLEMTPGWLPTPALPPSWERKAPDEDGRIRYIAAYQREWSLLPLPDHPFAAPHIYEGPIDGQWAHARFSDAVCASDATGVRREAPTMAVTAEEYCKFKAADIPTMEQIKLMAVFATDLRVWMQSQRCPNPIDSRMRRLCAVPTY